MTETTDTNLTYDFNGEVYDLIRTTAKSLIDLRATLLANRKALAKLERQVPRMKVPVGNTVPTGSIEKYNAACQNYLTDRALLAQTVREQTAKLRGLWTELTALFTQAKINVSHDDGAVHSCNVEGVGQDWHWGTLAYTQISCEGDNAEYRMGLADWKESLETAHPFSKQEGAARAALNMLDNHFAGLNGHKRDRAFRILSTKTGSFDTGEKTRNLYTRTFIGGNGFSYKSDGNHASIGYNFWTCVYSRVLSPEYYAHGCY